jgi:phlorizin synthase
MVKTTIVMYPSPTVGHIISMVELAKLLSHHHQQEQDFSITMLLTTGFLDHPSIDSYINRISTSHPLISFHRFPSVTVTHSNTQSLAATGFQFIKRNVVNVESKLRQITQTSVIKSFIIDMFCTSAMEVASTMGIPVYYFFTSGAAVLALCSYFPKIHSETAVSFKEMVGVEIVMPGNAPLNAALMPGPVLDREDPAYWEMLYFCEHLSMAKGIVVNTFRELEVVAVKAVEDGACFQDLKRSPPPVYCIGPLIADPQQSGQFTLLLLLSFL